MEGEKASLPYIIFYKVFLLAILVDMNSNNGVVNMERKKTKRVDKEFRNFDRLIRIMNFFRGQ
jgi:hypothetical protein